MDDDKGTDLEDAEGAIDETAEEIDYTKLDPAKIPHHIVQQTQAFGGVMVDLQQTRESKQRLQENYNVLESELDKADDEEVDPDAPITQKQLDARLEKEREARAAERQKRDEQQEVRLQNASLTKIREAHPVGKEPEGLDGDTVVREGGNWLARHRPKLFEAAVASNDPAGEIYDLSLAMVPAIKKRAQSVQHASLLDKIKRGGVPPGPGGLSDTGQSELLAMIERPTDELLAEAEKDELG
jgi:hypothetical protein